MKTITESVSGYFSLTGNRTGNPTVTGWTATKFGEKKKGLILKALQDTNTDKVYKRGGKLFRTLLNGIEEELKEY